MTTMQEDLLNIICELDYTWYTDIRHTFDKIYDSQKKKAKIVVPGYRIGYDPETGKEAEDYVVYSGIKEYCWEYDFGQMRIEGDDSPVEGQWICILIERMIAEYVKDTPAANLDGYKYKDEELRKHYLVADAYSVIRTKILEFQSVANDQEYIGVLNLFLVRLRDRLYSVYGKFRAKAIRVKKLEEFMLQTNLQSANTINLTSQQLEPISVPETNKIELQGKKAEHNEKQNSVIYEENSRKNKRVYQSLKEVFVTAAAYHDGVEALKIGEGRIKPVISANNEYLLGSRMKGSIVGWIEVLKVRGHLKTITNVELTTHLNNEIKGLNIYPDGSILSETATSHARTYFSFFGKLIK